MSEGIPGGSGARPPPAKAIIIRPLAAGVRPPAFLPSLVGFPPALRRANLVQNASLPPFHIQQIQRGTLIVKSSPTFPPTAQKIILRQPPPPLPMSAASASASFLNDSEDEDDDISPPAAKKRKRASKARPADNFYRIDSTPPAFGDNRLLADRKCCLAIFRFLNVRTRVRCEAASKGVKQLMLRLWCADATLNVRDVIPRVPDYDADSDASFEDDPDERWREWNIEGGRDERWAEVVIEACKRAGGALRLLVISKGYFQHYASVLSALRSLEVFRFEQPEVRMDPSARFGRLRTLREVVFAEGFGCEVHASVLKSLPVSLERLVGIRIGDATHATTIEAFLRRHTNLRELDIRAFRSNDVFDIFGVIATSCRQMKRLRIVDANVWLPAIGDLRGIIELVCSASSHGLEDDFPASVFDYDEDDPRQRYRERKRAALNARILTDDVLVSFAHRSPGIERLSLTQVSMHELTVRAFEALGDLRKLTDVELVARGEVMSDPNGRRSAVDDGCVRALIRGCASLKKLTLGGHGRLTDAALDFDYGSRICRIESLTIADSRKVGNRSLAAIADWPHVRALEFRNCGRMTAPVLRHVIDAVVASPEWRPPDAKLEVRLWISQYDDNGNLPHGVDARKQAESAALVALAKDRSLPTGVRILYKGEHYFDFEDEERIFADVDLNTSHDEDLW